MTDNNPEKIYIKYIDLEEIIYTLWQNAKTSSYLFECSVEDMPILTKAELKKDINAFIKQIPFELSIYYGRMIYVKFESDFMDVSSYNTLNRTKIQKKINKLKINEMKSAALTFYKHF